MGAKQYSTALRIQHLQQHDELHLIYLDSLTRQRGITDLSACVFPSFLPFNDKSQNGFNGFIPSAQWLRDIYDHFMEAHRPDINQHTAMLSAHICAIDHSFKVISYYT